MPPPGLLRLGGELQRMGWEVGLEDLAYRQAAGHIEAGDDLCASAARWLLERGPTELLGLSVMGATLPAAIEIARLYRAARPETAILLGGPGTTGIDVPVIERFAWIDAVVRGEGEGPLGDWWAQPAGQRSWRGISGVTWRETGGTVVREPDRPPRKDLDQVADYAWSLLPPLTDYKALTGESEGLTPLDSGRGCAYDCSFCTIGRYWQRRSRPLPAERLAREILDLRDHPGAKQAYLCHDLFGADRRHALELCERLIAAGSPVPFEVRARLDHLGPELLARMAEAGCYRVLLGIESASHDVRERHQKNLRSEVDPLAVIDACEAVGIVPILSLILGLPGEGRAELEQTLDLCAAASLRHGVNLSLHLVNPQPGCGLGEDFGEASQPIEGIAPDMALGAGLSRAERGWIQRYPDLFSSFHLLPASLFPEGEADLRRLAAMAHGLPELWHRYPRTWNLAQRLRGGNALSLWEALQQDGRSFAGWVMAQQDRALLACLRWEQASIRVATQAAATASNPHETPPSAPDQDWLPRPAGEVILSPLPLGELAQSLRSGAPIPPLGPERAFAIVPIGGTLGSVRTLQISADTHRILGWLARQPKQPRSAAPQALQPLLAPLEQAGLVVS